MLTVERQVSRSLQVALDSGNQRRRFEGRFARGFPALAGTWRFTVSLTTSPRIVADPFRAQLDPSSPATNWVCPLTRREYALNRN
jgi:hypothetical protein